MSTIRFLAHICQNSPKHVILTHMKAEMIERIQSAAAELAEGGMILAIRCRKER